MVFPEDGDCARQNVLESNGITWCMEDGALSAVLIEDKINYTVHIFQGD
jgi:hypothetical protein